MHDSQYLDQFLALETSEPTESNADQFSFPVHHSLHPMGRLPHYVGSTIVSRDDTSRIPHKRQYRYINAHHSPPQRRSQPHFQSLPSVRARHPRPTPRKIPLLFSSLLLRNQLPLNLQPLKRADRNKPFRQLIHRRRTDPAHLLQQIHSHSIFSPL